MSGRTSKKFRAWKIDEPFYATADGEGFRGGGPPRPLCAKAGEGLDLFEITGTYGSERYGIEIEANASKHKATSYERMDKACRGAGSRGSQVARHRHGGGRRRGQAARPQPDR
jgi:hypothetical protein